MIQQLVFVAAVLASVNGQATSPIGPPTPHAFPDPFAYCRLHDKSTRPNNLANSTGTYYLTGTHYTNSTCGKIDLIQTKDNTTAYGYLTIISFYIQSGSNSYNQSYSLIHHTGGQYLLVPVQNYNGSANGTISIEDTTTNKTEFFRAFQIFTTHQDILLVSCSSNNGTRELYKGRKNNDGGNTYSADQRAQELNITQQLHPANRTACPPGFFKVEPI